MGRGVSQVGVGVTFQRQMILGDFKHLLIRDVREKRTSEEKKTEHEE